MGMLIDRGRWLLVRVLVVVQLAIASILLGYVWAPIAAIVAVLYVLWYLVTGSGFENIELLLEPVMWYWHQVRFFFGVESDFWAVPYRGM